MAKPADWKYQSKMCSSWSMVSCSLNVDISLPMTDSRASTENMETSLKVGVRTKARTHEYIPRNGLTLCFVPGGTERVGPPDSEWRLSD